MWACRSFLRRPNALIASRLQPAYRHDPTNAAVPCRNLIAASRRHVSDATNGDPHPAAAEAATTKQHLYLVLDDQKKDYGIYKLDVDADLLDGGHGGSDSLPRPAHIRMGVPEKYRSAQFASTGGCIVATGCLPYEGLIHGDDFAIVTILYDVKTATLSVSTHPTETLQDGYVVAVPVENRMYVLDSHTDTVDSFHVMTTSKDDDGDDFTTDGDDAATDGDDVAADGEVKQRDWGWYPDSPSSRCGWTYGGKVRSWSEQLPFSPDNIQAYAVHPRGCTIYVSARVSYDYVETFAYDTTIMAADWTSCVIWGLPFKGHARYDRQLNMWVGLDLHVDEEDDGQGEGTTGYLCACGIPPSEYPEDYPPGPARVCSMEKILLDDPDRRRIDFKLVYMGERSEYCLFERLRPEGAGEKKSLADGEECVLRLTMFHLKYESDEPDHIRIMDRRACSYKVSRHRGDFEAQAFCL
jgi:hypothetical protein